MATTSQSKLTAANDNPGGAQTLDPLLIQFVTVMAKAHAISLTKKERQQ